MKLTRNTYIYYIFILSIFNVLFFTHIQDAHAYKDKQTNKTDVIVQSVINHVFSESEKDIIKKYYNKANSISKKYDEDRDDYEKRTHSRKHKKHKKHKAKNKHKKTPPGLAKKKHLPPGLQKHIEKHGKLPAGLEKRNIPYGLNHKLPPLSKGIKRIISGKDIVLIDEATEVVLDIIYDVIKGQ